MECQCGVRLTDSTGVFDHRKHRAIYFYIAPDKDTDNKNSWETGRAGIFAYEKDHGYHVFELKTTGTQDSYSTTAKFYGSTETSSDQRLKQNIIPLKDNPNISKFFDSLNPVQFNYLNSSKYSYGLIAQEVLNSLEILGLSEQTSSIIGTMVQTNATTGEEKEYYTINYQSFIPYLIFEVQELKKKINNLTKI